MRVLSIAAACHLQHGMDTSSQTLVQSTSRCADVLLLCYVASEKFRMKPSLYYQMPRQYVFSSQMCVQHRLGFSYCSSQFCVEHYYYKDQAI